MLQGINLDEVKQYNATLKQYREKAANLNAEIEYTNKELDALCAELTAELGKPVTRDNIEQIYNEQVASIESTLQSGKAVLAKIAGEEQNKSQVVGQVNTVSPVPSAPSMQGTVSQPSMGVTPPVQNVSQVAPPPVQGSLFNGQAAAMPNQPVNNTLPPMFNL